MGLGPTATPLTPSVPFVPLKALAVKYLLGGSAPGADITFATPSGTSQRQGVDVALTTKSGSRGLTVPGFQRGGFLYISAQNSGEYGTLIGKITVDDVVVSRNESSGAYSIGAGQGRA